MKRVFEELENIKAELTERQARVEQAKAKLKLKQLKWEESREKAFAEVPEGALWRYKVIDKEYCFTTAHMLRFPESIFAIRASGRWKTEDVVYLDRNFVVFKLVALALCTGVIDERIPQDELDFYGIPKNSHPTDWELSDPSASFQDTVFKAAKDGWSYARGPVITTKNTWYISVVHPTSFYIGIISQNQNIWDYTQVFGIKCNSATTDVLVGVCRVDCISPIRMDRNTRNEFRLEYCPQSKRLLIVKDGNVAVDQAIRCESPCLYLGGIRGDEMTIKEIP